MLYLPGNRESGFYISFLYLKISCIKLISPPLRGQGWSFTMQEDSLPLDKTEFGEAWINA
jgi:hypothetical protein